MGGVTLGDQSLIDGKNIINFMLLYVIGDTARKYSDVLSRFRVRGVLGTYIVFNVFIVVVCTLFSETKLVQILFILCYQYCSPGLLINAILIFFLFMRINVKSSLINYSASSVFAVYLIHCNNVVFPNIVKPLIVSLFKTDNCFLSIIYLFLLAVGLFVACIVIDKLLTPIWKQTLTLAEKIDRKLKIDYK